jgi:nucleoside 2-deoxyribosyltransferase
LKTCFVIGPIGQEGSETRKRSDQVLKHIIVPVCEQNGYEAIRVDKIHDSDIINQTIIKYLRESELVIADLTDHNPNAFYETGFRSALGKPLIQLIEEGQNLPFDVSGTRTIFYKMSDPDKIEITKNKLIETIKTVAVEKDSSTDDIDTISPNQSTQMNQQIFSLLLDIKDGIENLESSIKNKERSDIEGIISALANQMQKNSPEIKMMEILFPAMLNNPEKFINLMELMNNTIKTNKSS